MSKNTIYALSTSFKKSAIAIIRVSGENAYKSLEHLTKKKSSYFLHSTLHLTPIFNGNKYIDKPLIVRFNKDKSYTGEKLVEYHLHGSLAVIKELLDILSKFTDHRLASPGEFTKRALENGKLDILEAEGINDLINAETSLQKEQALREYSGEIITKYIEWQNELKQCLAFFEATLDFSDEDIPQDLLNQADANLSRLQENISQEIKFSNNIKKLKNGILLAILGAPNVGKSSLINYFTKNETAIVSSIAGTTRDVIEVFLDINGFPVKIADTAGLRSTNDEIEKIGVHKATQKALESDIKILLLDAKNLSNTYMAIEEFIDINTLPSLLQESYSSNSYNILREKYLTETNTLIIINKVETREDERVALEFAKLQNLPVYLISLQQNKGLDIFNSVFKALLENITSINEDPAIMQERHFNIVTSTLEEIIEALKIENIELKSHHLRQALYYLGQINGKVGVEDILDVIFGNFCIGK